MAGYPRSHSSEMDPGEDLIVAGLLGCIFGSALKTVEEHLSSVEKYPNPLAPSFPRSGHGGQGTTGRALSGIIDPSKS
jgi:hypothetical protein